METYGESELREIMNGAIIVGSGGGGDVRTAQQILSDSMALSDRIQFVHPDEVEDDSLTTVVSGMGSPAATKKKGFDMRQCVLAFEALERATGRKIAQVAAFETGGGNSLVPVYVAAACGIAVVDGDGVGRSVPEMCQSMYQLYRVPTSPFVMADDAGTSIVLYTKDSESCERLGRAIVTEMGGAAGTATHLMDGPTVRTVLVPGTFTMARRVGRCLADALTAGADPVAAVAEATHGYPLIRGEVTSFTLETIKSHDYGRIVVTGDNDWMKVDFKNENMLVTDSRNRIRAMAPDLIMMFGLEGEPLTNADIEQGMKVGLVAAPADTRWRKPGAFDLFRETLADFGYTGDYMPVERIEAGSGS